MNININEYKFKLTFYLPCVGIFVTVSIADKFYHRLEKD